MSQDDKPRTVTPEEAAQFWAFKTGHWLDKDEQRSIALAAAMADGSFRPEQGRGIIFDDDGRLVDGRHRMRAVMLHGCPVELFFRVAGVTR